MIDQSTFNSLTAAREDLGRLLCMEETFWKQKSRVQWLQEGDKNTKFFHAVAKDNHRRHMIRKIQLEDGTWVEDQDAIGDAGWKFFESVFYSETHSIDNSILQDIPSLVTI